MGEGQSSEEDISQPHGKVSSKLPKKAAKINDLVKLANIFYLPELNLSIYVWKHVPLTLKKTYDYDIEDEPHTLTPCCV